jgi:chloramphenicol 3-O-phosphotransferase
VTGPARLPPAILLITGIQAAGKSTVAQCVAEMLPRAVHLRGDLFRRMIVSGRADMTPDPSPAALGQLTLRHQLTAAAADRYFQAGFTVVAQDIVLGSNLPLMVNAIRSRPLLVVVLAPRPAVVAAREEGRAKVAYGDYSVQALDDVLRQQTPHIGMWLDTSTQTPDQTAAEILQRAWSEAAV